MREPGEGSRWEVRSTPPVVVAGLEPAIQGAAGAWTPGSSLGTMGGEGSKRVGALPDPRRLAPISHPAEGIIPSRNPRSAVAGSPRRRRARPA